MADQDESKKNNPLYDPKHNNSAGKYRPKTKNKPKGRPRHPIPGEHDPEKVQRYSRYNVLFGQKLRMLRNGKDLTQKELARNLQEKFEYGFDATLIGRLERADQGPLPDESVFIARYFECDLEWLLATDMAVDSQNPLSKNHSYASMMMIARNLTPQEAVRRLLLDPTASEAPKMEMISKPAAGPRTNEPAPKSENPRKPKKLG